MASDRTVSRSAPGQELEDDDEQDVELSCFAITHMMDVYSERRVLIVHEYTWPHAGLNRGLFGYWPDVLTN